MHCLHMSERCPPRNRTADKYYLSSRCAHLQVLDGKASLLLRTIGFACDLGHGPNIAGSVLPLLVIMLIPLHLLITLPLVTLPVLGSTLVPICAYGCVCHCCCTAGSQTRRCEFVFSARQCRPAAAACSSHRGARTGPLRKRRKHVALKRPGSRGARRRGRTRRGRRRCKLPSPPCSRCPRRSAAAARATSGQRWRAQVRWAPLSTGCPPQPHPCRGHAAWPTSSACGCSTSRTLTAAPQRS
jgi:hypothetical protein